MPGEKFPISRADWASVTGLDAQGVPVTVEGTGLIARMLQHETGHLDALCTSTSLSHPMQRAQPKPSTITVGEYLGWPGCPASTPTRLMISWAH